MSIDRELIRRGVIVPTFKPTQSINVLTFPFKGRHYLNFIKARNKVRSLNLTNVSEWRKYCYLNDVMPHGVPENPEIVYRNNGWKNFNDWLGVKTIIKVKKKKKIKDKAVDMVKNYKFLKLSSKRLPKALTAIKLVGNLSRRSSYEYTNEEAEFLIKNLKQSMRKLKKIFKKN
jgi:hypothetical protein